MRNSAVVAIAATLGSIGMASGQSPARLGAPRPAGEVARPEVIAVAHRTRGAADDTPVLGVPEPGYPPAAPLSAYPPPAYPAYPPVPYYPPGYPPYPPPGYAPAPAYAPPPGYAPAYPPPGYPPPPPYHYTSSSLPYPSGAATEVTSTKGDAVRRTSFSSRSASGGGKNSISKFGESVSDSIHGCCEWIKGCLTADNRNLFESDHSLDIFASPVSNPFFLEDPRSLTEIRPIFFYQSIPGSNWVYQGGEAYFYGIQARVALTDSWSVVLNKFGGVTINPGDNTLVQDSSGLAEIWLGPKWTFYRNSQSGTAAALGLTFQIPAGPSGVAQDTGDFGLNPYLSVAQNFGRSSYGSFNVMNSIGYNFGVGSGRSDFFYNGFHIDYDVANLHKFYPLIELNWFHYTSSGNTRPIDQEGADLANLGGTGVSGRDYFSIAPGFRYKFTEQAQFGLATDIPLISPRDLNQFRLNIDFIFRY